MRKMLKVALIVVLASVLLISGCITSSRTPVSQGEKVAPDFQLEDLGRQSVALSEFQGSPLLLNFWATWCSPCRSEMPHIQQVYDEWSGGDLVVLAVNIGESSSTVKEFMQAQGLSFPVLLDTKKEVAEKYGIQGIPTTFFIDRDGVIQAKIIGAFPSAEAIKQKLREVFP